MNLTQLHTKNKGTELPRTRAGIAVPFERGQGRGHRRKRQGGDVRWQGSRPTCPLLSSLRLGTSSPRPPGRRPSLLGSPGAAPASPALADRRDQFPTTGSCWPVHLGATRALPSTAPMPRSHSLCHTGNKRACWPPCPRGLEASWQRAPLLRVFHHQQHHNTARLCFARQYADSCVCHFIESCHNPRQRVLLVFPF